MPTTVVKSIGTSSRDYSTLQAWEDAAPVDLTLTRSNTATGGSTSTIVLDAGASGTDGIYVGLTVTNASSQERLITAYVGATKTATIGALNGSSATWTAPIATDAFTINSVIWQGQAYNDSEFTGAFGVIVISGSTSDATHYKELTAATGQSFQDNASVRANALAYNTSNGVAIRSLDLYTVTIRVDDAYTRCSRLQFKGSPPGNGQVLQQTGAGSGILIKDCIFEGSGTYIATLTSSAITLTVVNCVFFKNASGGNGIGINGVVSVIGCTVVGTTDQAAAGTGIVGVYSPSFTSCAIFGFTTPASGTYGAITGDYNATDQSSGLPGSHHQYSVTYNATTPFTQAAVSGHDLRAIAATALAANGFLDATNAPNDISGFPRSASPTIGAWQLGSSGPTYVPFVDEAQTLIFAYENTVIG